MVSRIEADTTAEGLYAYYANKSILGEIVRAKMLGNKEKVAYELTLGGKGIHRGSCFL